MSTHQGSLFGPGRTLREEIADNAIRPRDPSTPEAAKPRLSSQCYAILSRLREGPATNRELAAIALKYSGRISDLRVAGYAITVVSHDHATGLVTYRLTEESTNG